MFLCLFSLAVAPPEASQVVKNHKIQTQMWRWGKEAGQNTRLCIVVSFSSLLVFSCFLPLPHPSPLLLTLISLTCFSMAPPPFWVCWNPVFQLILCFSDPESVSWSSSMVSWSELALLEQTWSWSFWKNKTFYVLPLLSEIQIPAFGIVLCIYLTPSSGTNSSDPDNFFPPLWHFGIKHDTNSSQWQKIKATKSAPTALKVTWHLGKLPSHF